MAATAVAAAAPAASASETAAAAAAAAATADGSKTAPSTRIGASLAAVAAAIAAIPRDLSRHPEAAMRREASGLEPDVPLDALAREAAGVGCVASAVDDDVAARRLRAFGNVRACMPLWPLCEALPLGAAALASPLSQAERDAVLAELTRVLRATQGHLDLAAGPYVDADDCGDTDPLWERHAAGEALLWPSSVDAQGWALLAEAVTRYVTAAHQNGARSVDAAASAPPAAAAAAAAADAATAAAPTPTPTPTPTAIWSLRTPFAVCHCVCRGRQRLHSVCEPPGPLVPPPPPPPPPNQPQTGAQQQQQQQRVALSQRVRVYHAYADALVSVSCSSAQLRGNFAFAFCDLLRRSRVLCVLDARPVTHAQWLHDLSQALRGTRAPLRVLRLDGGADPRATLDVDRASAARAGARVGAAAAAYDADDGDDTVFTGIHADTPDCTPAVVALADALCANAPLSASLERLSVAHLRLDTPAVCALAQWLSHSKPVPALQHLSVAQCRFRTAHGAADTALATVLERNGTLTSLDVRDGNWGSGCALTRALCPRAATFVVGSAVLHGGGNTSLQRLRLAACYLADDPALRGDTGDGDRVSRVWEHVLRTHPALRSVESGAYVFGGAGKLSEPDRLLAALQHNRALTSWPAFGHNIDFDYGFSYSVTAHFSARRTAFRECNLNWRRAAVVLACARAHAHAHVHAGAATRALVLSVLPLVPAIVRLSDGALLTAERERDLTTLPHIALGRFCESAFARAVVALPTPAPRAPTSAAAAAAAAAAGDGQRTLAQLWFGRSSARTPAAAPAAAAAIAPSSASAAPAAAAADVAAPASAPASASAVAVAGASNAMASGSGRDTKRPRDAAH